MVKALCNTLMTLNKHITQTAVEHFQESARRLGICLEQLSKEQLWQDRNQHLVSVGNLVLHLCGNMTQYILSGIGGQTDQRQRDQEFKQKPDLDAARLADEFQAVCDQSCDVVGTLTEKRLQDQVTIQGFEHNVCSALLHVLEHLSYHIGQISMMTKIYNDTDLGYYAGHDLNKTNE